MYIMKARLLSVCFMFCIMIQSITAQVSSLGLIEESNIPLGTNSPFLYHIPQMRFVGDRLYVATPKGLYTKDISDSGKWDKLPVTDNLVVDFAVNGDTLAVLTPDVLYLSTDCGKTYATTSLDIFVDENTGSNKKLYHVTFHPHNSQRIYVAYGGVSCSSDFGKTWEKLPDRIDVNGEGMSYAPVGVLFNPNDPTNLIAYANTPAFNSSALFYSCDEGTSWSLAYYDGGVSEIHNVAFHPNDKNKMIVCGVNTYLMQEQQGQRLENVYKQGSKYYPQLLVHLFDVVYDTRNPNILYGADMSTMNDKNIVILHSVDGGLTWKEFYSIECEKNDHALRLAIHDNVLAVYSYANGIYLLDVDAVGTSVSSIVDDESESAYYDLMGRKVTHPTRGIYIKEGRKVVMF